jgi:hypothetical protein
MNTVGTLRSILLASIAAAPLAAALAAPQVTPLGEADKHGAIVYSVTCDSGRKKILQCVRDDRHCGYAGDRPLAELIDEACAATPAQAPAPAPADDALPFETAPAQP